MAKRGMIERELKRRKIVLKYKDKRTALKNEINQTIDFDQKLVLQHQLQKMNRNSSPTRLKNHCAITGNTRGYYRFFDLSRHVIRELAHEGELPGITKSSW